MWAAGSIEAAIELVEQAGTCLFMPHFRLNCMHAVVNYSGRDGSSPPPLPCVVCHRRASSWATHAGMCRTQGGRLIGTGQVMKAERRGTKIGGSIQRMPTEPRPRVARALRPPRWAARASGAFVRPQFARRRAEANGYAFVNFLKLFTNSCARVG